jgi:hypothetical protein
VKDANVLKGNTLVQKVALSSSHKSKVSGPVSVSGKKTAGKFDVQETEGFSFFPTFFSFFPHFFK